MADAPDQLIGKCVSAFCRGRPTDPDRRDELVSEAGLAYARCLISHDPAKGSFLTHVWIRMNGAMLDYVRDNAPYSRKAWRQVQAGEKPVHGRTGEEMVPVTKVELNDELLGDVDVADGIASRLDILNALAFLQQGWPREAAVVARRMAGWTQSELASELGLTESRVSQIEKSAFKRIKPLLAG